MSELSWQQELNKGFTSPQELLDFLHIDKNNYSNTAHKLFKTKVPLSFAKRMRKGDINCPLLKQVLPCDDETITHTDYELDPLQESKANPVPGLLHKYQSRALVTLATKCAINCRYCFRRHFDYKANQLSSKIWDNIFSYLKLNPDINELILSGGDPLLLSNRHLEKFLQALSAIQSIKTVRFHSRIPVVLPNRIDLDFLNLFNQYHFNFVMVIHSNHPQELNDEVQQSMCALKERHVFLFNQSVLLKGVNDDSEILARLSQRLFEMSVLPYYLHLLDKVQGVAHFDITQESAVQIHQELLKKLPGYLVPKLVREVPGESSKTPILY